MADALELLRLSHLNAIVDGYDSAVDHLVDVLGAALHLEIPDDGESRACLISLGGVIFELFAPNDRDAERGQGRLLGKFGDHYLGAEYTVPDVAVARERCAALGVRIINDPGVFFFTHPAACHGISFELWDQNWNDLLVEGSEASAHFSNANGRTRMLATAEYWRDEHPLGLTGLVRISSAVEALDDAVATFRDVVGATERYRVERPAAAADAVGMQLGDTVIELLAPTTDGPSDGAVRQYLDRYGERIRSTVFGVADLVRVEKHFAERGIGLVDGDAPGVLAIPPEHNHGLRFEFSEES